MKPAEIVIVGAGGRGTAYATHIGSFPELARVTAVAEPNELLRKKMAERFSIPRERTFSSWEDVAALSRFADAVVIATQDEMHLEPALKFTELGYNVLLEKPMAPEPHECQQIVQAAVQNDVVFAVCHVMRYTPYTGKVKQLLDAGAIGDIVSLQHLEPVGYWHQAHSYVRGNWRREDLSSPMLLAKSCHDLDWIRYLMGRPCAMVSSFGSLVHFRCDQAPDGAGERCMSCEIEAQCAFSAKKIYLGRFNAGHREWPLTAVAPELTLEALTKALETGPYGRCVYACDNDVVDNQVVNMQFEGGATASFTMTGFTEYRHRQTRIFGTRGTIEGDGRYIKVFDFLTDKTTEHDAGTTDPAIVGGHSGGDLLLTKAFITALATGDRECIVSGPDETLESHLLVFAAEEARKSGVIVNLDEYKSRDFNGAMMASTVQGK